MTATTSGTRRPRAAAPEPLPAVRPTGWGVALRDAARRSLPELAVLVALMGTAYWRVVTSSYAFLDDYSVMYRARRTPDKLLSELVGAGRPLTGVLDYVLFGSVPNVGDLAYLRVLGLTGVTVFICLTLLVMRAAGVPRGLAAAAALLIGVLPCTGLVISWTTTYHVPLALLLGTSAALVISPVPGGRDRVGPRRIAIGALLLTAAICDYQPAAMVFWGFAAMLLLLPATAPAHWRAARRAVIPPVATFAGASLLGLVFLQIGIHVTHVTSDRGSFVSDLPGKLTWYAESFLPRAFAPMIPVTHHRVAVATAVALVIGLVLLGRRNGVGMLLTPLLAGAALLGASVPNLLTAENWASSRSSTGVMIVVVLLGTCAVTGALTGTARPGRVRRAADIAVQALAGAVAVLALVTMHGIVDSYMVKPQIQELAMLRVVVAEASAQDKPVTLVPASWADTRAPGISFDEFGTPSSCAPWVPIGLFQLLYREQTGRWFDKALRVAVNPPDGSDVPAPPGQVVIDFGHMLQPRQGAAVYAGTGPSAAAS